MLARIVLLLVALVLAAAYPDTHLQPGNTTVLAVAHTLVDGGSMYQVFAIGQHGELWQKFQTPSNKTWSYWRPMPAPMQDGRTPFRPPSWDSDPAVGVNKDGSVEIFIRNNVDLDLWQFRMSDPKDPTSWLPPRECICMHDGGVCHNKTIYPEPLYWNTQPVFPTSNMHVVNSPIDGRLQVFYRGFDGSLYYVEQVNPGDGYKYTPPTMFEVTLE